MIKSEILQEKYRVQMQLAAETPSIRDYLLRAQQDAKTVATSYGLQLRYADSVEDEHPFAYLLDIAEDLDVDDLAENHDQYLYEVSKC